MARRPIAWRYAWIACLVAGAQYAHAGEGNAPDGFRESGWAALDTAMLDRQRGGFLLPSGLQVSFGFERQVHVNGELVSSLRVQVADVGRISREEAEQLAALGQAQVVQLGPGNTARADMAGLVVQNTLDNQRIQVQTTLDAGVAILGLLQAANAAEVLQGASRAALGGL